jgi:hypothetical protein
VAFESKLNRPEVEGDQRYVPIVDGSLSGSTSTRLLFMGECGERYGGATVVQGF